MYFDRLEAAQASDDGRMFQQQAPQPQCQVRCTEVRYFFLICGIYDSEGSVIEEQSEASEEVSGSVQAMCGLGELPDSVHDICRVARCLCTATHSYLTRNKEKLLLRDVVPITGALVLRQLLSPEARIPSSASDHPLFQ